MYMYNVHVMYNIHVHHTCTCMMYMYACTCMMYIVHVHNKLYMCVHARLQLKKVHMCV